MYRPNKTQYSTHSMRNQQEAPNMNPFIGKQKLPLILTSNGKTGRRVAERFREQGLPFKEGSRNSEIPFDWYNSSTWEKALQDVSSVYVVFYPDLAVPSATSIIKEFTLIAKSSGVEHLVLLSGRGEEEAQMCERIVMESGLDWTVVRASWFSQNFSESFFLESILQGQVVIPFGEVKEPFVDADDIADVVFAALTNDRHRGQLYEVTGPNLLSFRSVISYIAAASNRKIEFHQVSMDEYVEILTAAQVPQDYISLLTYLFSEVLDGRNTYLTDGVDQALGRSPRSFASYIKNTAETGVWDVEQTENKLSSAG